LGIDISMREMFDTMGGGYNYVKVNPAENMTIFVLDKVNRNQQPKMANKLMNYNSIHGEQVGFIESPKTLEGKRQDVIRLQMMGGEFCGNAARSFAACMVFFHNSTIKKIKERYFTSFEISGVNELINCEVRNTEKENVFYSKVQMPLPQKIEKCSFSIDGKNIEVKKIELCGITHFIVDADEIENNDDLFSMIKRYMDREKYDAFGIMYYDPLKYFLTPLVYVKATDSLLWERSCASGTTALAVSLTSNEGEHNYTINQPGGILEVSTFYKNNNIKELTLAGPVEIVAKGVFY
jgi:diaminopimelate epimerase